MSGKKIILLACLFAVIIAGIFNFLTKKDGGSPAGMSTGLTIKVLDIGQGDAILIRSGKDTVLVDSSDVGMRKRLLELLRAEKVDKIDLLVATHPHADHIGGMETVLENFSVKKLLDSGQVTTSKTFTDYLKKIKAQKIDFVKAKSGAVYKLDEGASLEVLCPTDEFLRDTDSDLNNNSIVLRLVKGNFAMLLTGDIQREAETLLIKNSKGKLKANVLKSPHHGSNTSSTTAFLRAVGAKDVIVSCGRNNDYGHPKEAVLKRYKENGMAIYVTANDGTVTVTSDGKDYKIEKEGRK